MENQFAQTDVAIVGGGLAGLSAANYLARAGMSVTLFEKSAGLGGRAATQCYDSYYFNHGIHALYTGGATSEVLQELGITYSHGKPKEAFVLYQGELHTFPNDPLTLLRNTLLSMGDKLELIRVLAAVPRIKAETLVQVSVREWLEQTIRRPQVQRVMTATACTLVYSAALDLVSAEVFIKRLQISLKHPVYYIDGGWQTLVDALRRKAEQAGAHIVSSTRVEAVEHLDGHIQGIRLRDGRIVQTSAVIIATTPQDAVKLVDEGAYTPLRQIVDALVPARVACLDVALSKLPDPRHAVVQDLESPRFMSTQSLYVNIAPQGRALIHTFKQLDPMQQRDPHEDERDLEDLLDTVQPGWRDVLVKRVYLPRIEAIGMLPTASGNGYAGRSGPQVPGITNLYLAGDWIGEGFLADASMGSARQIAQLLLQADLRSTKSKISVALIQ